MSDNSAIEWPDRTVVRFTEKDGRQRATTYTRTNLSRPGTQERRIKRASGLSWCRGCRAWLPTAQVNRNGVCKPCANAEYRAHYAADGRAIRARSSARKRSIEPLPIHAAEYLTEQFEGRCAYCTDAATTWDHVMPVRGGGQTTPGNVVPACASCNSSKKATELFTWLEATGRTPAPSLFDVLALEAI